MGGGLSSPCGGRKHLLVGTRRGNDVSVDGFIAITPVYSQVNERHHLQISQLQQCACVPEVMSPSVTFVELFQNNLQPCHHTCERLLCPEILVPVR